MSLWCLLINTWNLLLSSKGEIGAIAFNDQVERLYDYLQEGNVYTITKAKITMNNKRFSNLTSDYELHLKSSTEIKLVSVKSWFVSND
jgi:replication factor A1